MQIKEFLSLDQVLFRFEAHDKARLLDELAVRAADVLRLDPGIIRNGISKREALGSTGIGGGVALPHARIEGLKSPFSLFARLATPIDFDSIDGKPVDVVFMLLLPLAPEGEQLNALACVSRKLREAETLDAIRAASDTAHLFGIIAGQ